MTAEISDLQKKRAYNQIWNAAANYGFLPDFRFYTPEGRADVYWNTIIGLARRHYDYDQLKKLFRGLEQEEEHGSCGGNHDPARFAFKSRIRAAVMDYADRNAVSRFL